MDTICICGHKIELSYHDCEYRCSSAEIWWCEKCGAIAVGYNGEIPEPKEFDQPLDNKSEIVVDKWHYI